MGITNIDDLRLAGAAPILVHVIQLHCTSPGEFKDTVQLIKPSLI